MHRAFTQCHSLFPPFSLALWNTCHWRRNLGSPAECFITCIVSFFISIPITSLCPSLRELLLAGCSTHCVPMRAWLPVGPCGRRLIGLFRSVPFVSDSLYVTCQYPKPHQAFKCPIHSDVRAFLAQISPRHIWLVADVKSAEAEPEMTPC